MSLLPLQAHFDTEGEVLIPFYCFGIALMGAAMAAFRAGMVCGLPSYTVSFRYPHR